MAEAPTDRRDGAGRYEIHIRGQLADRWSDWFDGFALTRLDDGTTVLAGCAVDQAALHGVLRTLADLGLPLLSVRPGPPDEPTPAPTTDPC